MHLIFVMKNACFAVFPFNSSLAQKYRADPYKKARHIVAAIKIYIPGNNLGIEQSENRREKKTAKPIKPMAHRDDTVTLLALLRKNECTSVEIHVGPNKII